MAKPYAFRYQPDIQSTLAPWRDKLGSEYENVVAKLQDRDRALEDHISLDVAQGYLDIGTVPNGGQALTAAYADITGATVTVSVPAGRRLKLTLYANITNIDASPRASFTRILDEDDVVIIGNSETHDAFGGSLGPGRLHYVTVFITPEAGEHTYRVQALINGGSGTLVSNDPANNSGGTAYLSVEDCGPATRT